MPQGKSFFQASVCNFAKMDISRHCSSVPCAEFQQVFIDRYSSLIEQMLQHPPRSMKSHLSLTLNSAACLFCIL